MALKAMRLLPWELFRIRRVVSSMSSRERA